MSKNEDITLEDFKKMMGHKRVLFALLQTLSSIPAFTQRGVYICSTFSPREFSKCSTRTGLVEYH